MINGRLSRWIWLRIKSEWILVCLEVSRTIAKLRLLKQSANKEIAWKFIEHQNSWLTFLEALLALASNNAVCCLLAFTVLHFFMLHVQPISRFNISKTSSQRISLASILLVQQPSEHVLPSINRQAMHRAYRGRVLADNRHGHSFSAFSFRISHDPRYRTAPQMKPRRATTGITLG